MRLVQQAVLQILEPIFEPAFHPGSDGFRHNRRAHTAIAEATGYRSDQLCEMPGEHACRVEDGPESTMMGAAQETWLGEGLHNDACWNLVARQVRVMPLVRRPANGDPGTAATDTWSGYPAARARLV
jgi:alkaline phosphatase D